MMRLTPLALVALVVVACGGETEPVTTSSVPSTSLVTSTSSTMSTTGPFAAPDLGEEEAAIVEAATTDLARREGVPADQISLVSFERVTWNDGSLGCPEPGKLYTQALVDGSRTILELEGATYDYHAGADDEPFLCESAAVESRPDPSLTVPSSDAES